MLGFALPPMLTHDIIDLYFFIEIVHKKISCSINLSNNTNNIGKKKLDHINTFGWYLISDIKKNVLNINLSH
jgi:hypothetical protein